MVALKNNRGFSLVETMTVIGIVAIMGTFAVPPLISWLQNKGLNNAARDLYSNMRKAQSIAVKNNRNCAISFDGTKGYIVYVDEDKSYTHQPSSEKIVAQVSWAQYRNVQLVSANFASKPPPGQPTVVFQPNLLPMEGDGTPLDGTSPNGIITLINTSSRKADLVINVSGNISLVWK